MKPALGAALIVALLAGCSRPAAPPHQPPPAASPEPVSAPTMSVHHAPAPRESVVERSNLSDAFEAVHQQLRALRQELDVHAAATSRRRVKDARDPPAGH